MNMLSPRGLMSPRQWRLRRKKKDNKMENRLGDMNDKSISCRNIRGRPCESESSSIRRKFIEKRPSLWELSKPNHKTTVHRSRDETFASQAHNHRKRKRKEEILETVELKELDPPEIKKATTMKFHRKQACRNSSWFSSLTSDSEYVPRSSKQVLNMRKLELHEFKERSENYCSSSASSFVHLNDKNVGIRGSDEYPTGLRKATSLKTLMLEDMRSKIDGDIILRENSTSSVMEMKTEPNPPLAMKNLLTLRVKQEAATDLQISMWEMKTCDFGRVDWDNFINSYQHIVIDRSSKYAFIETSKLVKVC